MALTAACQGATLAYVQRRRALAAKPALQPGARRPSLAALEAVDPGRRLDLPSDPPALKLTHYLFRYPAKFHPPVAAALVRRFTRPGDVVLDPFVGSGTLLLEGALLDRTMVGVDVDPVAVAIASAKTRRYDVDAVRRMTERLLEALAPHDRGHDAYAALAFEDISQEDMERTLRSEALWVPAIPNSLHWFRRYVVVDLARIHRVIRQRRGGTAERRLLEILFASIIRNASNADPVPVSGLEVTSHMRRLDEEGRVVDPFALMRRAVTRGIRAIDEWTEALGERLEPVVRRGDAMTDVPGLPGVVDAVITSPPYHNAVDYYRRHQLEMYWLGLTASHQERLDLLPHYIGRPRIRESHPLLREPWPTAGLASEWEHEIAATSVRRARDFRHYMLAMSRVMRRLAERTREGAPVVMVVGHSAWNGGRIPTVALFEELAGPWFAAEPALWYPVRNRYMSYARHNGASIDREHVVVLRRSDAPVTALA
jgi:hypothetical protein